MDERSILLPARVALGAELDAPSVEARVALLDAQRAHVYFLAPPPMALELGSGVTVFVEGERNLVVVGVVTSWTEERVVLKVGRTGHREDRWSPRERGALQLRVAPSPSTPFDVEGWAEGEPSPTVAWTGARRDVELSLTGLAFSLAVASGAETWSLDRPLLLSFVHDHQAHRTVARIVRRDPDAETGWLRLVVAFEHLPKSSGAAVADLIMAWQDAALEAMGAPPTDDLPPWPSDVAQPSE